MLAKMGVEDAIQADPHLANGLNVYNGNISYEPVARDLNMKYVPFKP